MRPPKMLKTLLLLRWLKLFHLKYCFLCRADVWPLGRLKRLIIDKNQNNLAAVKPAMLRPAMFRNPPPFTYSPSSAGDVVVYVAVVDEDIYAATVDIFCYSFCWHYCHCCTVGDVANVDAVAVVVAIVVVVAVAAGFFTLPQSLSVFPQLLLMVYY